MWLIDYINNLYNQKWFFNRHQNVRRSVERQRDCKIMVKKGGKQHDWNDLFYTDFCEIFWKKIPIYVDHIHFLKL